MVFGCYRSTYVVYEGKRFVKENEGRAKSKVMGA